MFCVENKQEPEYIIVFFVYALFVWCSLTVGFCPLTTVLNRIDTLSYNMFLLVPKYLFLCNVK